VLDGFTAGTVAGKVSTGSITTLTATTVSGSVTAVTTINKATVTTITGSVVAGTSVGSATVQTQDGTLGTLLTNTGLSAPTITYGQNGLVTVSVSAPNYKIGGLALVPGGTVKLSVDGGTAVSHTLSGGSYTFTVTRLTAGTHTLAASLPAQNVTQGGGQFDYGASNMSGTITVNANMTVASTATVKALQNVSTGYVTLATFNVSTGTSLTASNFAAAINWTDGNNNDTTNVQISVSGSQANGYVVTVMGSHPYAAGGQFKPVVTLTYVGLNSVNATATVNVANDVTKGTKTQAGGYTLNRKNNLWYGTLTVQNTTKNSISGYLIVELTGLGSGFSLQDASVTVGTTTTSLANYITYTASGAPILTIPKSALNSLSANQTITLSLGFNKTGASYGAEIFSDPYSS